MDDGGVLWRDQEHHLGRAGEECSAGCCCCCCCCCWFSVSCLYARVFFSASISPVKSDPAAVEVSAKAGLAGSCRLYVDCWIGR